MYQRKLISIEGSPPRISRAVHPNKSCMDDQGTPGKTQTQKLSRYIRLKQGQLTQEECFSGYQQDQPSGIPESRGKGWNKEQAPLVEEDQVRKYLSKLDEHQYSTGTGGMHLQVMKDPGPCHYEATLDYL